MVRLRFAAALLALACGGFASAADSPLAAFSDDTDVVVRIKAPKDTIDKAASLVEAIQPGFGAMVRQNAAALGPLISNPSLAGVDQTKDWYIAVYTDGQNEPTVVFGIPVTDEAAAKAALREGMKSKAYGSWLYYSDDEESIPDSAKVDAAMEAVMKGEPTTVFDKGDVAVFVNLAHLMEQYSDELEEGVKQAKQQLENIPAQPGMDAEAVQKMYGHMIDYTVQGLKDSKQCTIALNVGAEGISFEDYLGFTPDSETAKLLLSQTASDMAIAAKLPADAVMIFGMSGDVKKMIDWGMSMSKNLSAKDAASQKAFDDFGKGISGMKFGSIVGSMSFVAGDAGMFKNVMVTEVTPTAKYKELARSMAKSMGKVETPGMKQETKIEVDAETYGSQKADLVTVKQEFDETTDPNGMVKQVQALMFGPAGIQSRVVYLQDKFVQTMGGGKATMTEALKSVDGTTTSAAVTKYRKDLIASPNVMFLVDVPGLIVQAARVASGIPGLPVNINTQMLDNLKFDKSFMGFTAAAEKNAVRAKTRIPVEQLRSIFSLVMTAQQMMAQPN